MPTTSAVPVSFPFQSACPALLGAERQGPVGPPRSVKSVTAGKLRVTAEKRRASESESGARAAGVVTATGNQISEVADELGTSEATCASRVSRAGRSEKGKPAEADEGITRPRQENAELPRVQAGEPAPQPYITSVDRPNAGSGARPEMAAHRAFVSPVLSGPTMSTDKTPLVGPEGAAGAAPPPVRCPTRPPLPLPWQKQPPDRASGTSADPCRPP